MKKFAAFGLVAALAFAPVASFAQTATPDASPTPSMSEASKSPVEKTKKHHAMRHMMHKMHRMHHMHHMHAMKKMAPAATPSPTDTPKS
jgi:hypothetical protein